jgi:hypothetical protein
MIHTDGDAAVNPVKYVGRLRLQRSKKLAHREHLVILAIHSVMKTS